jgi:tetratricopeptide (TPR) repeat protein
MKLILSIPLFSAILFAQTPAPNLSSTLSLVETGHCQQAFAAIPRNITTLRDPTIRKRAGLAGLLCATEAGDTSAALGYLSQLTSAFPRDPDVLLSSTHAFSALADHAADELHQVAPNSAAAYQLAGESAEMAGKTDDAINEYRRELQANPRAPEIHYRIGRLILSKQHTAQSVAAGRNEMLLELQNYPQYAGAEFVLGELAQEAGQWPQAVQHFGRATQLDPTFGDAFLGLGIALFGENNLPQAIPALERAEQIDSQNSEVHRQLAIAYVRMNRPADAQRESALQRQTQSQTPPPPARAQ